MNRLLTFVFLTILPVSSVFATLRLPRDYKPVCIKRTIYAREIKTGNTKQFSSTCAIPEGWIMLGKGMPIDAETSKKKVEETTTNIVATLHIPTAMTQDRKMFLVSKDYIIAFSNSTIASGIQKTFSRGRYSLLPIVTTSSGDIYVTLQKSGNAQNSMIYLFAKDGNSFFRMSISVHSGDFTQDGYGWKIIQ